MAKSTPGFRKRPTKDEDYIRVFAPMIRAAHYGERDGVHDFVMEVSGMSADGKGGPELLVRLTTTELLALNDIVHNILQRAMVVALKPKT
jgi:hypothetical protein